MDAADQAINYSLSILNVLNFFGSTYGVLILISLIVGIFQYRKGKKEMREKELELRKYVRSLKKSSKNKQ